MGGSTRIHVHIPLSEWDFDASFLETYVQAIFLSTASGKFCFLLAPFEQKTVH